MSGRFSLRCVILSCVTALLCAEQPPRVGPVRGRIAGRLPVRRPRVVPWLTGVTIVVDVSSATSGYGPACGLNVGHTVWFEVTAQTNGPITFSTCHPSTTFDTVIQVWLATGDCEFPTRLDDFCVDDSIDAACDNGCSFRGGIVTIFALAGETYLFEVGSYDNNAAGCDLCLGVRVTICGDDQTPPETSLSVPPALGCVCNPTAVVGTANDQQGTLTDWDLAYRPAAGDTWIGLATGTTPVIDAVLANWDTTGLGEGYYLLRLTARNGCGLASVAVQVVWVDALFQSLGLNSPPPDAILGGLACFDCIAWDQCFDYYRVDYRPAGGGTFQPVDPMHGAYGDTKLNLLCASWDTYALPDGDYEVRLLGETDCGNIAEVTQFATIDNTPPVAAIATPLPCSTPGLPGEIIPVVGTALDTNLAGWTLQYTGGSEPGWVTIAGGTFNVNNGLLADWDTSDLEPCCYTLRLIATDRATVNCNAAIDNRSEYAVSISIGCPADVNLDGEVDVNDLVEVIVEWGECIPAGPAALEKMLEVLDEMSGKRAVRDVVSRRAR